nr:unnamed protein product [Callosobruchus analis]
MDFGGCKNIRLYKCGTCKAAYKHERSLRRHLRYECGTEPKFPCPSCPRKFRYLTDLKNHDVMFVKHVRHRINICNH